MLCSLNESTLLSFWMTFLILVISFALEYLLSDIITTPNFFWILLAWCLYPSFYLWSIYVFIFFKVSWKQHIVRLCFFIQSDNCCLFNWGSRLFVLNMIIDMVSFKSTFSLLAFCLIVICSPFPPSSPPSFWLIIFFMILLLIYKP